MRRRLRISALWVLSLGCVATVTFLIHYHFISHSRPKHIVLLSSQERLTAYGAQSRRILTSRQPDGEVRIPFVEKNHSLYLKGEWAGRYCEAMLDTGSDNIAWPAAWHLTGVRTGIAYKSAWAGGAISDDEIVIVPSIKIGDFLMKDMPTASFNPVRSDPDSTHSSRLTEKTNPDGVEAILGATAFLGLVLTIDYNNEQIILRGRSYDITQQRRKHGDQLLPVSLEDGYLPVVKGNLNGIPARLGIDTGCATIPINGVFLRKFPTKMCVVSKAATVQILGRSIKVKCIKKVNGFVGKLSFTEPYAQAVDFPSSVDALIGLEFLKHYRVTIDYTRNLILFEPYPISNSTPHQAT